MNIVMVQAWMTLGENALIFSLFLVFKNSFMSVGVMGWLATFPSMSDIFALQPTRRYAPQAFTQGVASASSSLSLITLMTPLIIRVPKVTGTLEANVDKSGMTRDI